MSRCWEPVGCAESLCVRLAKTSGFVLGLAILLGGAWEPLRATTVRPLSFDDAVRSAEAIFVGRVVAVRPRWTGPSLDWIETDYVLQVEDAVLPAGRIQRGEQVTLTFWGGEIDGQIQELAGCPAMVRDGRYVLMVQPGWQTRSRVSPLVGVWQGFFPVVEQYEGSRSVVVDHTGLPLYCLEGAKIIEAAAARRAKGLVQPATLDNFLTTLRADNALIRRTHSDSTAPAARFERRSAGPGASLVRRPSDALLRRLFGNSGRRIAAATASPTARGLQRGPQPASIPSLSKGFGHCNLPVALNSMPDASQTFGPVAEECWRIWNHYFKDMFKLREGDAAPPAWGNGKFDLHGMLKDEELKERFGKEWDEGTASMTFRKFGVGGVISEADVVLNAAMSWTLNNAEVFEGADSSCFRYTMVRELSQVLGLQLPVTGTLSVRCEAPRPYTAFSLPFGFDLSQAREIYADHVEPRREVQSHLFYVEEGGEWKDASVPTELKPGTEFELTGLWIENAAAQDAQVATAVLLTKAAALDFGGEAILLANWNFSNPLPPGYFFGPENVYKVRVPQETPPGEYHLAVLVADRDVNEGAAIEAFPFSYTTAFSKTKVKVEP